MGILQKAAETYDNLSSVIGEYKEGETPFAPISHILSSSDIEITITGDGNFVQAISVDKEEGKIILPVSEESAGRTSSPCAHPLCDQLAYVASYDKKRFPLYLETLKKWAVSQYSHPTVRAVLAYVQKETVLSDLVSAGIVSVNEDGLPEESNDNKLMIRWRVYADNIGEPACWKDKTLFDAYIRYYQSTKSENPRQICMVSGDEDIVAVQHPKGIVSRAGGNAKLISANDSNGFTFRGRFSADWQAATVSYTVSQKAHNAIRWLAENQAVSDSYGGRVFLCWNPKGITTPKPSRPFRRIREEEKIAVNPTNYSEELKRTLQGWKESLPDGEDIVIAAFDAATPGRLSLSYYNELKASDFLNRLHKWDESCCWYNGQFGIQSPSLYKIVQCAYGTEQNGRIAADDRVVKEQVQRLVACRVDSGMMPHDIMRALVNRASTPQAYEDSNRRDILYTACAVIRKYRIDHYKEEQSMALEPKKKDRSYQFGRLLAVMEKAERDTYGSEESREPNAIRKQSIFAQRPLSTARVIEDQLERAYFQRLSVGSRIFYKNLIGEILEIISEYPENEQNRPLGETYLLGYYLQRKELYTKKTDVTTEDEKEEK